jgi:inhibitor of cysteine peptidase
MKRQTSRKNNIGRKKMKKLLPIIGVLGVVIVACFAAGCSTEVAAYSDPSKTIEISSGTEFDIVISLDSNPTTGYSWFPTYDQDELVLVNEDYQPGEDAQSGLIGAGGTQIFRFKALKTGQATISMSYQRPWETGALETKVFNVEVK